MGQNVISLHQSSLPQHNKHVNLEFLHESDKEKRRLKYDFVPLV